MSAKIRYTEKYEKCILLSVFFASLGKYQFQQSGGDRYSLVAEIAAADLLQSKTRLFMTCCGNQSSNTQ